MVKRTGASSPLCAYIFLDDLRSSDVIEGVTYALFAQFETRLLSGHPPLPDPIDEVFDQVLMYEAMSAHRGDLQDLVVWE